MFFWFGFVLPYCVLLLCHCHCAIEASIAHCVAQPCISNALFAVALRGDIRSLHCSLFWFFLVPPLKADIAARVYHVTLRGGMTQSPLLQFGWLNGKEIGEVDCSSWPSSEEWPNGGFGRPAGLGVAGYNSYSEFSKHGLICTFPSCVFHESRLPEGRFIAIKLVIFEKA